MCLGPKYKFFTSTLFQELQCKREKKMNESQEKEVQVGMKREIKTLWLAHD